MKLKSKQIQCALEYSPCKNIEGLHKACNRHVGFNKSEFEMRKYVIGGTSGFIGDIIGYELGLNPQYPPWFKKRKPKPKKPPQMKSRYKGVSYNHMMKQWQGQITILGKQKHLGYHESEEVLAARYNEYAEPLGRKLNEVAV